MFKKIAVVPGCQQHIGSRNEQQDSFGFSDFFDTEITNECGYLSVLADGMGGLQNGKEASQIVVNTVLETYINKSLNENIESALHRSAKVANKELHRKSKESCHMEEMGTTLVCSVISNGELYYLSVGDSRIYLIKNNTIKQLNIDHNYGLLLDNEVKRGTLSKTEADCHPNKDHLISFLGIEKIDLYSSNKEGIKLSKNDVVLMCSDGLTNNLSDDDILKIISRYKKYPQQAADCLVENVICNKNDGTDNVTVIVLKYVSNKKI